jgi:hypothetical protein
MTAISNALNAIRENALNPPKNYRWDAYHGALEILLGALDRADAFRVALSYAGWHLAAFERVQPDDGTARQLIQRLTVWLEEGDESPLPNPDRGQAYDTPGSGNYLESLYELYRAYEASVVGQAATSHLVSATAESIMAILIYEWGMRHPDQWAAWCEGRTLILPDQQYEAREQQLWLQLADELEALLPE